jgi:putative lipoprotein
MTSHLVKRTAAALLIGCVCLPPAHVQAQDRWLGRDKALHVALGAGIAGAAYAGTSLFTDSRKPRIVVGVTFGLAASAAKEVRDRRGAGDPSWKDFTMGALGSLAGTTVAWLIDRNHH